MVDVTSGYQDLLFKQLDFEQWLEHLVRPYTQAQKQQLAAAWALAKDRYANHKHLNGKGWLQQGQTVAALLASLDVDIETVIAGLLYGLPELESFDSSAVIEQFGSAVGSLISGLTKITQASQRHTRLDSKQQAEPLRKMILAMAGDIRVVFIALAVRLVEVRSLDNYPPESQRLLAQQTLDVHASLANRLGLSRLKWELQDLCLRTLEPEQYRAIAKQLATKRVDREREIVFLQNQIKQTLETAGISAQVSGRPKHIYSIWKKMQKKHLPFKRLFDIRAFRVLVDTIGECYSAYAAIGQVWPSILDEYSDYIAVPKTNNYQSLHMVAEGPDGKSLEIQFRTREMNEYAELGHAAHWRYKEGGTKDKALETKISWLRELLHWVGSEAGPQALKQADTARPFKDQIYVFTPQGDVMDLPPGATPVEFAYRVHTQVGHHCRGAKVNGQMVPLDHQLKTGDKVSVLTGPNIEPRRDWLNPKAGFLVSSRTRSKVQRWFRERDYKRNIAEGRAILERELHRLGFQKPLNLEKLAQRSKFSGLEPFLEAIGRGDMTATQIAGLVSGKTNSTHIHSSPKSINTQTIPATPDAIVIDGVNGIDTRIAHCCEPTQHDEIVGYITRTRGITIHRSDCVNIKHLDTALRNRVFTAAWSQTKK